MHLFQPQLWTEDSCGQYREACCNQNNSIRLYGFFSGGDGAGTFMKTYKKIKKGKPLHYKVLRLGSPLFESWNTLELCVYISMWYLKTKNHILFFLRSQLY